LSGGGKRRKVPTTGGDEIKKRINYIKKKGRIPAREGKEKKGGVERLGKKKKPEAGDGGHQRGVQPGPRRTLRDRSNS